MTLPKTLAQLSLALALSATATATASAGANNAEPWIGDLIGKTLAQAQQQLKAHDFNLAEDKAQPNGYHVLTSEGPYLARRHCALLVGGSQAVNSICLLLPQRKTWKELLDDWKASQDDLASQFGPATETQNTFDGAQPGDDQQRLQRLQEGNANFVAQFSRGDHVCFTSIAWSDELGAHVCVMHIDQAAISDALKGGLKPR